MIDGGFTVRCGPLVPSSGGMISGGARWGIHAPGLKFSLAYWFSSGFHQDLSERLSINWQQLSHYSALLMEVPWQANNQPYLADSKIGVV